MSPNKTLQGIYDLQVWPDKEMSRRSMHNKVFKSGWDYHELMKRHRDLVSKDHQGRHGQEVIVLDWTLGHHNRGPEIFGNKWQYDPALRTNCFSQLLLTACVTNKKFIDPIEIVVQKPSLEKKRKRLLDYDSKRRL